MDNYGTGPSSLVKKHTHGIHGSRMTGFVTNIGGPGLGYLGQGPGETWGPGRTY